MAEQSQIPLWTPDDAPGQLQQAGDTPRAPRSAWEADPPRIERAAREPSPRPITDWASI